MKHAKTLAVSGILLAGAMTAGEPAALAQGGIPYCTTLPNTVYMGGTTAVLPVIRHFGAKLKQVGVTLLWNENSEGCGSVAALVIPPKNLVRPTFSQYDEVGSGASSKIVISNCIGAPDQIPDLVINDTYWMSCFMSYGASTGGVQPLPANLKEFVGPVQGIVPIVASSYLYYSDITVAELLDLYVCGANANILTFSDSRTIYNYDGTTSGIRELWARGLGASNGQVTQVGSGSLGLTAESMANTVASTISPDTTIGYTSTEFYDENRDQVRALKVRGVNQVKAYLPDTDSTSLDKINIREGRYTIQGSLKLVTAVDANGVPLNAGAKKIIDWMQGNPAADPLPFDVNEVYAERGVVPQCAMRVTKDNDMPVFRHYTDPAPCNCSFEILATGKKCIPGCTACTDSSTCPTGKICSHGYCE
jgi:hypothetical protein